MQKKIYRQIAITCFSLGICSHVFSQGIFQRKMEVTPVTVIGREEVRTYKTGDITEIISTLPQSNVLIQRSSEINLRGLGSNRTLFLLGGSDKPVYVQSVTSDINSIPIAAIEQIEVIRDNKNFTYGSDAISGVVSFVTRADMQNRITTSNDYQPYYTPPRFILNQPVTNPYYQGWIRQVDEIYQLPSGVTSSADNSYGQGQIQINLIPQHDFRIQEIKLLDNLGNARQTTRYEWYPEKYRYAETWYYDCEGEVQHYATSFTDVYGNEFQLNEGIYEEGTPKLYQRFLNPQWNMRLYYDENSIAFTPFQRKWADYFYDPEEDCDDDDNDCPANVLYGGFSYLSEDLGTERWGMPGVFLNYTRMLCDDFGITGHVGYNSREEYGWKYSHTRFLAGVSYTPLESANCNDPFILTTQVLAGIVSHQQKDAMYNYSGSYFSAMAGATGAYQFSDRIAARVGAHYAPTFGKGNIAHNFILSGGVRLQF